MDDRSPDDTPASKRLADLLAAADARTEAPAAAPAGAPAEAPAQPSRPPVFRDADAFRPSPEKRPAFRGDAAFRDDRFEDPQDRAAYGTSLADEIRESERPLADRGARLAARLIDAALLFAILGVPVFLMEDGDDAILGFVILALLIPYAIYQIRLLSVQGQTIGKRALKIRIVDVADGTNPGFGRAAVLRDGLFGLVWLVPVVGPLSVLGDVLCIFRADRRCLHDQLARTVVVRDAA